MVQYFNNVVIGLRNAVITEKYPKNENPDKVIDIVEEILNFRKRRKKRTFFELYQNIILTLKQMLPIALVQEQTDNTSHNLLNKIRQIISLESSKRNY